MRACLSRHGETEIVSNQAALEVKSQNIRPEELLRPERGYALVAAWTIRATSCRVAKLRGRVPSVIRPWMAALRGASAQGSAGSRPRRAS